MSVEVLNGKMDIVRIQKERSAISLKMPLPLISWNNACSRGGSLTDEG